MTDTTANRTTFDPYGLPDGHGSQRAWEDLARGVEAVRAGLGWGQPAALYGVTSPAVTTARHGGDVSGLRGLLEPELDNPAEQDSGVVMELVLAGTDPDPWKLIAAQSVPTDVAALALVWEPSELERTVAVVTRAGRTVIVRRVEGQQPGGSCACALVNGLRRIVGVPVDAPSLSVEHWMGRMTATVVADELMLGADDDVEQVVLAAAAYVSTLAAAPAGTTWAEVPYLPARHLLRPDIDVAWFGPSTLAWFISTHSEAQHDAWQRLSATNPPAARTAREVLARLGWAEPAEHAPIHG